MSLLRTIGGFFLSLLKVVGAIVVTDAFNAWWQGRTMALSPSRWLAWAVQNKPAAAIYAFGWCGFCFLVWLIWDQTEARIRFRALWRRVVKAHRLAYDDLTWLDFPSDDGYNPEFYLVRAEADGLIRQAAARGPGVLILGRPMAGKTRAAYECLKRLRRFKVLIPKGEPVSADSLPKRLLWYGKVALFVDDLDRYAEVINPRDMQRELGRLGVKCTIVATCRNDPEYGHAKDKMERVVHPLEEVQLPDISGEEGEALARGAGLAWRPAEFDHTPGSVVLGIQAMGDRYRRLPPLEKAILKAAKLLYRAAFPEYPLERIRSASEGLFGEDKIARHAWDQAIADLQDQSFCGVSSGTFAVYPAYLHTVVDWEPQAQDFVALRNQLVSASDHVGLLFLGVSEFRRGHLNEALTCWDLSLGIKESAQAYASVALALYKLRRIGPAKAKLEAAIRLDPRLAAPRRVLGLILFEQGTYPAAVDELAESAKLEPGSAVTRYVLGQALFRLGRVEEAEAEYKAAIDLDPMYAPGHGALAVVSVGQKDYARAKYHAETARELFAAQGRNDDVHDADFLLRRIEREAAQEAERIDREITTEGPLEAL